MNITRSQLDHDYAIWFHGMKNVEQAKLEILALFSQVPDDLHSWTEQDFCEQARKIIDRWNDAQPQNT